MDPSQRQARDRTRRGRARGRPHRRQHRPAGQLGRAGGPRRRRGAGVDGGPARPSDLLGVRTGRPRHPGCRRSAGADPSQQPGGQPRRRRSRRSPRWRRWVRPCRGVPVPGGGHGRRDHALPPVPGDPLARDLAARCSRRRLGHGAARRRPARRGTTEPGGPSNAVGRRGTARLRRRPGCPRSQGRAEAAGCHARRVRPRGVGPPSRRGRGFRRPDQGLRGRALRRGHPRERRGRGGGTPPAIVGGGGAAAAARPPRPEPLSRGSRPGRPRSTPAAAARRSRRPQPGAGSR